ncbi:KR domain-containing protein, partial [archaeon]
GQSAYGAANRYLDVLMEERRKLGMVGTSIRWPAISGKGMAAVSNHSADSSAILSLEHFSSAISFLLSSLDFFQGIHTVLSGSMLSSRPSISPSHVNSHVQRSASEIRNFVRDEVERILLSDEGLVYDDDAQLLQLGIDSLGASNLAINLSQKLGLTLSATLLFNYPTVRSICDHILSLMGSGDAHCIGEIKGPYSQTLLNESDVEVGVSGIGFYLPGNVNDLAAFTKVMHEGVCVSSHAPFDRFDIDAVLSSLRGYNTGLERIRYGGYLDDTILNRFIPSSLGISTSELATMDPAHRLLIQVSQDALADAGYSPLELRGRKVGVFIATMGSVLGEEAFLPTTESSALAIKKMSAYDAASKSMSVAAGRISYLFGFHGPAVTVDTACSSSLVAIHIAKQSLLRDECDIAIVAGVAVLSLSANIACAAAEMISLDGKCHTFDEAANGYCRSEGCCAIILSRVAEENKHQQYALIKGSAVMQDGKSASLTAPNGLAQQAVIKAALGDAKLQAKDISYIESHGTGTKLGDPIEVEALNIVYGQSRDLNLCVGGAKANFGHLEGASGLVGILSAIVALGLSVAPPNANLVNMNKAIEALLTSSILTFPTRPHPLSANSSYAAVSSFGFSGTISHMIIQQTPFTKERILSAKSWSFNKEAFIKVPRDDRHCLVQFWQLEALSNRKVAITYLHPGVVSTCCRQLEDNSQVLMEAALLELAYTAAFYVESKKKGLSFSFSSALGASISLKDFKVEILAVTRTQQAIYKLFTAVDDENGFIEIYGFDEGFSRRVKHAQANYTVNEGRMRYHKSTGKYQDIMTGTKSRRKLSDKKVAQSFTNQHRILSKYCVVPPPLLDALLQSCAVLLKSATLTIAGDANTQVPFSFDQI